MKGSSLDATAVITRQPLLASRFEIIKVLGEGAAGSVFHVRDYERDGKEVALKVLQNSAAFDEHTFERFRAEIRMLQEVQHPHIVSAFDYIPLEHTIAYTMEYVKGQDLAHLILERPLTFTELDRIFDQLLSALEALHGKGIFHRDLKLENILYSEDREIKITDFGLAKQEAARGLTRTGVLLGTAQYMPPEYIQKGLFDGQSDIYCVGILLYELIVRKRYLDDKSGKDAISYLIAKEFQVELELPPYTPPNYIEIIHRAMEPDPAHRFKTAAEMRQAFQTTLDRRSSARYWKEQKRKNTPAVVKLMMNDPLCIALELTLLVLGLAILWKAPWISF